MKRVVLFVDKKYGTFTQHERLENGQLSNRSSEFMGTFKIEVLDEHIKEFLEKGYHISMQYSIC